jgi:hypothetical protein
MVDWGKDCSEPLGLALGRVEEKGEARKRRNEIVYRGNLQGANTNNMVRQATPRPIRPSIRFAASAGSVAKLHSSCYDGYNHYVKALAEV